jgi:hypothetical protein
MAGRGPGNPTPPKSGVGRSPAEGGSDPCDIVLTTTLANVRASGTADLDVDVELDVRLVDAEDRRTVICTRRNGTEPVGTVLSRGTHNLITCIEQGNEYGALITNFDYGLIEVRIRRRR